MNPSEDVEPTRNKARDDVEFLASSWNRLVILEAVADGPRSRTELKELTGVSRVSLSRLLSELEERGWIVREADRFEATAHGAVVASEVSRLLDNIGAADELGDALEWLPTEQFDFELTHLRDVTVITPDEEDLTAPTQQLVDLAHQCSRIRAMPTGVTHEFFAALRDATVSGELSLEFFLPPKVFDVVSNDPELRHQFLEMVNSGNAQIFHDLGASPDFMLGTFDEHVMACGHSEEWVPLGTIETTNSVIRSWAESYFDAQCADARRLEPEVFTP